MPGGKLIEARTDAVPEAFIFFLPASPFPCHVAHTLCYSFHHITSHR